MGSDTSLEDLPIFKIPNIEANQEQSIPREIKTSSDIPPNNIKNEEVKEENKDSDKSESRKPICEKAYKRRNAYKSILRHMISHIQKNRDDIFSILRTNNFSEREIEHAFFRLCCLNEAEQKQKGQFQNSQKILKDFSTEKTINSYILRESLKSMERNWKEGKLGRIYKSNIDSYQAIAQSLYQDVVKLLEDSKEK